MSFIHVCVSLLLLGAASADPAPAFPTAEGAGKFAQGGRGGDVYHVTTLADDGPGSLREGIKSMSGPRTIVFDLAGIIELKTALKFEKISHLTIAGQTAPGEGITLKGWGIEFKNSSHLILRYLRLRLGDEHKQATGPDVISLTDCDQVIFDHLSGSWGIDGIQDTRRCGNYTLQWSIFSEALNHSLHPKGAHAMCGSFREPVGTMSIHHNLFTTSRDRHPTLGGGTLRDAKAVIDFRNNVIYNWTGAANVCDNPVNLINNYFKPGPETKAGEKPLAMKASLPDVARGYMAGNYFDRDVELNGKDYTAVDFERWLGPDSGYKYAGTINDWKHDDVFQTGVEDPKTETAEAAYESVLKRAGASCPRDAVDTRVLENVRKGEGRLIDSQKEVGGWPEVATAPTPQDTDQDGMPDSWEREHGLKADDAEDRNGDADGNGYTNLEEFLNALCDSKGTQ